MLNHFFDYLGKELGFKARIITASSCVTITGFDWIRIPEWAQQACLDQIEAAQYHATEAQIIFLAGVWNTQTQSADFNIALASYLDQQSSKQLFILSQVPRFVHNVRRNLRYQSLGMAYPVHFDLSYQSSNFLLNELASNYEHVEYWQLDKLPVFNDAPFYEGSLIYQDEHHLNEIGAEVYARSAQYSGPRNQDNGLR